MKINEFFFIIKNVNFLGKFNFSFSQEGEDMIIDHLLEYPSEGFYVDIGAHHPFRFSNTMKFYNRGWNGINIDAMPGSKKIFDRYRKRDINLEIGISDKKGTLFYYEFNDAALNSFDKSVVEKNEKCGYQLLRVKQIETFPINEVLSCYLPEGKEIDILDVDIEGMDEVVLNTIDWKKYRPRIVLAELAEKNAENSALIKEGYCMAACTGRTAIYMKKRDNNE